MATHKTIHQSSLLNVANCDVFLLCLMNVSKLYEKSTVMIKKHKKSEFLNNLKYIFLCFVEALKYLKTGLVKNQRRHFLQTEILDVKSISWIWRFRIPTFFVNKTDNLTFSDVCAAFSII